MEGIGNLRVTILSYKVRRICVNSEKIPETVEGLCHSPRKEMMSYLMTKEVAQRSMFFVGTFRNLKTGNCMVFSK